METFGEYIRQLRIDKDMSITKISELVGIDSTLWGRIERNERRASKDVISKIANIFDLNEQELMKCFLSDRFAYKILEENVDIDVLKVAEQKVKYLKSKK